jgi:hypothetical protein
MLSVVRRPALITLLTLAACSSGAGTALNPPKVDTLPGGIVQVRNTGPTAWRDTSGWRWTPTSVIKPTDGSPGELGDIASLAIGDDGSVYALQRAPAVIKAFGPDGALVRTIGKEGDGPGELRRGVLSIRGDTLLIQDAGNSRLTIYRTDGVLLLLAAVRDRLDRPRMDSGSKRKQRSVMVPHPDGRQHRGHICDACAG